METKVIIELCFNYGDVKAHSRAYLKQLFGHSKLLLVSGFLFAIFFCNRAVLMFTV